MSTTTQYNPNLDFNRELLDLGLSKTVYALVTPETEAVKARAFGSEGSIDRAEFFSQFREAWTGKQDALHENFFAKWYDWSKPVVDFDRANFPFYYPTAGASEPLRQIIFDHAAHHPDGRIFFFKGEYEGYKAMAEAAGLECVEVPRNDWRSLEYCLLGKNDLYFVSQPSAIDGDVWKEFNEFVSQMPPNSIVADVTYVGAVPERAITERFNLNAPSIRNIVFSLSKPFGLYYDRVGGVFARVEDAGLFGNKWFKSLSALRIGTLMMESHDVFYFPTRYQRVQWDMTQRATKEFGWTCVPSDVYILCGAYVDSLGSGATPMAKYLMRGEKLRICLTPGMAEMIGTTGKVQS